MMPLLFLRDYIRNISFIKMAKSNLEDIQKSPILSKLKFPDAIEDVATFCSNEMTNYGREVCSHRAIPSYIDGLKESTRKILWCAKDQLKSPLKVYQLCGIVAYKMAYVHGDMSLNKAIIGLAQPHNSNLYMLNGLGQFGGYHFRSAASPRYVGAVLSEMFEYVFMDNDLLTPQVSEGVECEPKYMIPIIPYVLCNNSSGIAMGFASSILARNPIEVTKECIRTLKNMKKGMNTTPKILVPEIPGFMGTCTMSADNPNKWLVHGKYSINKKGDLHIDDFIGEFEPFKEDLMELLENKVLTYVRNADRSFDIKFKSGYKADSKMLTKLHLESSITENPTFTDENSDIVTFNHACEFIPQFVEFRSRFYKERLAKMIAKTNRNIVIATNRIRFIKEHEDFYKKSDINKLLEKAKYDLIDDSYEYLLSMRVDTITAEKIKALEDHLKNLKARLKELKATDYIDLYEEDLNTLLDKLKTKK